MLVPHIAAPFSRIAQSLSHAFAVFASRRDLVLLDDRMLQDLGISRAQAEFEASRWLWSRRNR